MKACAWCANRFEPSVSYQIYCSPVCREEATKEKIAQRYNINRIKNRAKKERRCSGGCGTVISVYNENGFCTVCMVNKKKVDKTLKELRNFFDYEQR
jgi:hypothetical protein